MGKPSNYIVFDLECSPDIVLYYIHQYFGFVWPCCDAMSSTTKKCETLGQLFESLYSMYYTLMHSYCTALRSYCAMHSHYE